VSVTIASVTPDQFEDLVVERANRIKNLDIEIADIPFELLLESEQLKYKHIARQQLRSQFTILPSHVEPKVKKVLIRSLSPWSFRPEVWAELKAIQMFTPRNLPSREVYVVEFEDGQKDLWAIDDPDNHFEFKDASTYE